MDLINELKKNIYVEAYGSSYTGHRNLYKAFMGNSEDSINFINDCRNIFESIKAFFKNYCILKQKAIDFAIMVDPNLPSTIILTFIFRILNIPYAYISAENATKLNARNLINKFLIKPFMIKLERNNVKNAEFVIFESKSSYNRMYNYKFNIPYNKIMVHGVDISKLKNNNNCRLILQFNKN
ncbi:MAG: hypothetical protein U5N56_00760 [Candidatus Marinimicrobia bacterium]|nr:hypothetical protein [Candidatus Neomarinimicrobiota bacterium]